MKYTIILFSLFLLLISCSEKETYKTDVYGKWDILGAVDEHLYLESFEVISPDSVRLWGKVYGCTVTDSSILLPQTDQLPALELKYTLQKNFLIINYNDAFTMVLYPEGKELPRVSEKICKEVVGTWRKENHSLQLSAEGDYLMTGGDSLTYRVLDKGILLVEEKIRVGYPTNSGGYISNRGRSITADEMYKSISLLVPYTLHGDSLTIRYMKDYVTYTRE